jgi:Domain of unknown function (DUF397)
MDALNWRKASYSASNGGGCVEVTGREGMVLVRDTKDRGRGPVHHFTRAGWETFTAGVRAGEFDLDESGRLA